MKNHHSTNKKDRGSAPTIISSNCTWNLIDIIINFKCPIERGMCYVGYNSV